MEIESELARREDRYIYPSSYLAKACSIGVSAIERRRRLGDDIEFLAQENKLLPSAELLRIRSFICGRRSVRSTTLIVSVDDLRTRSLTQVLAREGVPGKAREGVPRRLVSTSPHWIVGGRGSGTDCENWSWSSSVEALSLLLLMLGLLPTHALSLRDQPADMNALSRLTEGARSCPVAVSLVFRRELGVPGSDGAFRCSM